MANRYLHQVSIPSAATETTLYTVPAATTAVVRSLRVTNASSGASLLTVTQYDSGDATAHYALRNRSLAVSTSLDVFNGVPFVMEEGDVLKVTSSEASVTFYLSYMEVDRT